MKIGIFLYQIESYSAAFSFLFVVGSLIESEKYEILFMVLDAASVVLHGDYHIVCFFL